MKLHPGLRLASQTSSVEVIVVRAGADDVDLRCGGTPMLERTDTTTPDRAPMRSDLAAPTLLGKRYTDLEETLEVLCTSGGDGQLSIGDVPLAVKSSKPLPASD